MIMIASTLYIVLLLLPPALGHMQLSWPYPIRSKFNPNNTYKDIDYSMTSPLLADGSNFPCKGFQNDRPIDVVTQYTPGQTYNFTLAGSATHGGGSCQISLSYDNGATFRVIKSIIGGCPLKPTYEFTVPSYVPQGQALLAWTWQNKLGNREYYMNCAEVQIAGPAKRHKRDGFNSLESLPFIWKANLPDVNNCTTTEGEIPVYPEPGPEVEYGDGESSSSPSTPGDCDAAKPYGATYKDLGDSSEQPGSSSSVPASSVSSSPSTSSLPSPGLSSTPMSTTVSPSAVSTPSMSSSTNSLGKNSSSSSTKVSSALSSTTIQGYLRPSVITIAVWDTVEGTEYFTTTETVATSTIVARSVSQAPMISDAPERSSFLRAGLQEASPSTVTVTVDCEPTTVTIIVTPSVSSSIASATASATTTPAPSASAGSAPPYATGDLSTFLPCVPGTYLCASDTTFYTCNYDSSGQWAYAYPRNAADGMECLPYLSPYSSQTGMYGQQANAPTGYYRDDRYIRSRPNGDCDVDGIIQCTAAGSTFEICDQGGWVDMGSVADGTICEDGEIVAS